LAQRVDNVNKTYLYDEIYLQHILTHNKDTRQI